MEIRKLRTKKFYNIGHWCRNERVGGGAVGVSAKINYGQQFANNATSSHS
jgi:hypothetical protein